MRCKIVFGSVHGGLLTKASRDIYKVCQNNRYCTNFRQQCLQCVSPVFILIYIQPLRRDPAETNRKFCINYHPCLILMSKKHYFTIKIQQYTIPRFLYDRATIIYTAMHPWIHASMHPRIYAPIHKSTHKYILTSMSPNVYTSLRLCI